MNPQIITSELEQNASVITEMTELPQVQTVVEEAPKIQTVMNTDKTPIETQMIENESKIVSLVNQPSIQVTSVNGRTGDVQVDSEVGEYKQNYYYKKNAVVSHNGTIYVAKQNFTSGPFNLNQWSTVSGGTQSDWNETNTTSLSFIKNKPTIPIVPNNVITDELFNEKIRQISNFEVVKGNNSNYANLRFVKDGLTLNFINNGSGLYITGNNDNLMYFNLNSAAFFKSLNMRNNRIELLADPQAVGDAANKRYVDNLIATIPDKVQENQVQSDWNAASGKGQILNKPDIDSTYTAITGLQIQGNELVAKRTKINGQASYESILQISSQPVYGSIAGLTEGQAQVWVGNQTKDLQWDTSKQEIKNITYSTEWNGWLIPEDGIYTVTAITETVDVNQPFGIYMQVFHNGAWSRITTTSTVSYPLVGRGVVLTINRKFTTGDKVNVVLTNITSSPIRVGQSSYGGLNDCYFSIVKVSGL